MIRNVFAAVLLWFALAANAEAQRQLEFAMPAALEEPALAESMAALARQALAAYPEVHLEPGARALASLHLTAGDYLQALMALQEQKESSQAVQDAMPLLIHVRARLRQFRGTASFAESYEQSFRDTFGALDDATAAQVEWTLGTAVANLRMRLQGQLDRQRSSDHMSVGEAIELVVRFAAYEIAKQAEPLLSGLLTEDDQQRYSFQDEVLIRTRDGANLSAHVVRSHKQQAPAPAALLFTIYTDPVDNRRQAKWAAARGYVGVTVDTRGKRLSQDPIEPYKHEVNDTYDAIDWISKQFWNDGQVGMYGGSYSGFACWAATKHLHPALKTIAPNAAAIPGLGLPMENNVFLNFNYGWAFYVGNNRYLDHATYFDGDRWGTLKQRWFESGRPYRQIDLVDGTPNRLLQRWLLHPAYDKYWQDMVPYGQDFSRIDIPVLSITGYFDDGQISAIEYVKQHYQRNPRANHYLVIGPYDHFATGSRRKPAVVSGYAIDPVAQFNSVDLVFDWFDHIMRHAQRPALLGDKINLQVMGTNTWQHAASLQQMSNATLKLHLVPTEAGEHHRLVERQPVADAHVLQTVDLADRNSVHSYFYPSPVVRTGMERIDEPSFISEPFDQPVVINGSFDGKLDIRINKKDVDLALTLFEVTAGGEFVELSYFIGRASFAADAARRKLLVPGKLQSVPFQRTRMVSRQLGKGSRLLLTATVNKAPFAQVNYGTGKDVSDESAADAGEPLRVEWHNSSFVAIPLWK